MIDLASLFRNGMGRLPAGPSHGWLKVLAAGVAMLTAIMLLAFFWLDADRQAVATDGLTLERVPFDLEGAEDGLNPVACWFDPPAADVATACYFHVTRQNPEEPTDGRIARAVITLSPTEAPSSDLPGNSPAPVVFVGGGPGVAATTARRRHDTLTFLAALTDRTGRMTVLQENRGAGNAHPAVDCPAYRKGLLQIEGQAKESAKGRIGGQRIALCRDALKARGVDRRLYSSHTMSADLERLREDLGAPRMSLIGVSYGTVVAQTYARLHPQRVDSLVLDSALPTGDAGVRRKTFDAKRTIAAFKAACAEVPRCDEQRLWARMSDLAADTEVMSVTIPPRYDSDVAAVERVVTTDGRRIVDRLAYRIAYRNAREEIVTLLSDPELPPRFSRVRLAELAIWSPAELFLALPLHEIVLCNDGIARGPWPVAEGDGSPSTMPKALHNLERPVSFPCENWHLRYPPPEPFPAHLKAPPFETLILAGALDSITPPADAATVAEHLPNSRIVRFPEAGHAVLFEGADDCARRLTAAFLNRRDAPDCGAVAVR